MSSGGGEERRFWCHACEIQVTPVEGVEDDVLCPQCHGGFVEEMENPSLPPPPQGLDVGGAPRPVIITGGGFGGEEIMSHILESVNAAILGQDQGGGAATLGGAAAGLEAMNPMMVLQSYLQNMLGATPRGGNIQIIFDNTGGGGGGGLRLPGAVGDYYLGGGLEQLIQQLMENDPNRYGTPPAAKSAVEGMPTIKITQSHLNSDAAQCAVCKDKFEEGAEARQMPCKHIYHSDCILPWLEMHSTCPVCRYEMPTEDSSQNPSNAASSASGDSNPGGATSSGGRRFRFQIPLPFRTAPQTPQQGGSSSEQGGAGPTGASNPGANNNNEGENSSEARQEDLD